METLLHIVQTINFYLSDYILVVLLVGTGVFFSLRTRFVQVRCFGEGMRRVFGGFSMRGGRQKGGLSSFQALTTAIAAQVGTGNIIGSCSAILVGGPGAIFWMWIIAFFGMSTIYAEAVLAQETRVVHADGTVSGGLFTTLSGLFRTSSAPSWRGSLRWPSPWPWALSAVWFSPTPSVRPAATPSAFPLGS